MEKKAFKVEDKLRLVLVGNPNSGKSTLFNSLTGLNQRIGNFPGVTVEKKIGSVRINEKVVAEVIDLPGTYSLSPRSEDERVTFDYLNDSTRTDLPELIVVVADASNLKRNLLLATQLIDSEQPTILVLNMMDVVERNKQNIDIDKLQKRLGIPVIPMNARLGKGTRELKSIIGNNQYKKANKFIEDHESKDALENTINRFEKIKGIIADTLTKIGESRTAVVTRKIDSVFTHPIWGFSIFLFILFLIFQAIFSWSSYPMEWIEGGFLVLGNWLAETLPQ